MPILSNILSFSDHDDEAAGGVGGVREPGPGRRGEAAEVDRPARVRTRRPQREVAGDGRGSAPAGDNQ